MALTLTAKEILMLLEGLKAQHGPGYSSDNDVASLQAKLSILLEMAQHSDGAFIALKP